MSVIMKQNQLLTNFLPADSHWRLSLLQPSGKVLSRRWPLPLLVFIMFLLSFQAFAVDFTGNINSHDPATIVKDGSRYYHFTTGNGIWYSYSDNLTNWTAGGTVFPAGQWPSWINSAVPGFAGEFWAPGIIQMNGYFYLYYSVSTFGSSRSAIGVVRTASLNNPNWQDLGMVVSSNGGSNEINAIDAGMFRDTNGRVYMTYGSWFGGIGVVEINPSTGKTTGSTTHIYAGGHEDIEAPYIMKEGNYYYLIVNKGKCCQGLESTYRLRIGRSTSITGPYSGWRDLLTSSGKYVGPGHFGLLREGGCNYVSTHYYDGSDNGRAKLDILKMTFSNGWPALTRNFTFGDCSEPNPGPTPGASYYQLRNRGTGLLLDGMGRTSNGSAAGQYANTTHNNSQWEIIPNGSYFQLRNRGTGLVLDGMGETANGSDVGQWANTTHVNSQWSLQQYSGNYYRLQNRGTGLYLDGMGRTANGSAAGQWANTAHVNAQWELILVSGAAIASSSFNEELKVVSNEKTDEVRVYPNPASDVLNISLPSESGIGPKVKLVDAAGKLVRESAVAGNSLQLNVASVSQGFYILIIEDGQKVIKQKIMIE